MKLPVYLSLSILFFCFAGCSKKKETNFNPAGAVVKTIAHSQAGTTDTYTYNGDGKIQLIQNSAGNKISYTYDSASITQTSYDNVGSVITVTKMDVDTFGRVIGNTVYDANTSVLSYHGYGYDQDTHMNAEHNFTAGYIVNGRSEWVWSEGNMWNYAIYDSTGTKIYDTYIWYYEPAITSIANTNKGQKFFGTDSKYLPRQSIRHSYSNGDLVYNYQYSFDGQQRVTEVKTYDYNNVLKNTDSYTYY